MSLPFLNTATFTDLISTTKGTSNNWNNAYEIATIYQNTSSFYIKTGDNAVLTSVNLDYLNLGNAYIDAAGIVSANTTIIDFFNKRLIGNWNVQGNLTVLNNGSSNEWNSTKTTVQTNSAQWASNVDTSVRSLTSNWENTFTFVNQKSAEFTLSEDSIFFDTNISEIEKSIIFGGITFQKDTAPVYDVINYDTSVTRISSIGNTYGGFINISVPISISYDSYCDIKNIQNHKGGFTFTSSSQTSKLTSVSFPDLKTVRDSLILSVLSQKGTLNFPELEYIGGYAIFGGSQNFIGTSFPEDIVSVNCPKLKVVINNLTIGGYGSTKAPLLSSVNFPQLIIVKGNFSLGGSTGTGPTIGRAFSNLIEINIPNLELCGSITFSNITSLTSFNFENLKIINTNLIFPSCTALREVAFPNVQLVGGYSSTFGNANTPSLTSISFPNIIYYTRTSLTEWGSTASLRNFEFGTNTLKAVDANTFTINQTLTQTSVDNLLKAFANLDGANGTQIWVSTLSLAGSNSAPSYTGGVTTTSAGTNFVRTGTTVVASVVGHGHTTGDIVTFTGNTQAALNGTYVVTVNSLDQFEYTTTTSSDITGGGTVTMRRTTVSTDGFRYFQIIALRGGTTTINFPT